jgi:uncharacterized membrane protein
MKKHLLRNMFIVGASALALAASTIVLPSVADAAGQRPGVSGGHGGHAGAVGHAGGNFRGHGGRGGYGGGGYVGGYYGGYCGPIQITLGLCGPYGY